MNISSINSTINPLEKQKNNKLALKDETFADMLKNAISEVNKSQVEGYNAMEGIATGNVKNLQEAVEKIEEAELSLKLALEVKNKALSAYKQISQMQV